MNARDAMPTGGVLTIRSRSEIVHMSGYTDDEIVRRGIVTSAIPFIQKPFVAGDLARAVRLALDA